MKKTAAALLVIALVLSVLSGCRGKDVSALNFAVAGVTKCYDPQIAATGAAEVVVRNCFEGLVYIDEAGDAMPGAATGWNITDDGTRYVFTLRQGAKWHITDIVRDGMEERIPENFAPEVTAADFVFGLRRAVDPNTGAANAALLANVTGAAAILAGQAPPDTLGVTATGKYTLEITLNRPEAGFLEVLSEPMCMPCNEEFFNATGGRYCLLMKYTISNGPFYLTRFDDTYSRIVKSDDYIGPMEPKTDVIWIIGSEPAETLPEKLKDKTYDGAYLSEAAAADLKAETRYGASDILRGLIFNCRNEALANGQIRAAFAAAADVNAVCDLFGKTPAAAVCPAALEPQAHVDLADNAETAAALLAAGLKALEKESLTFTLLCEPAHDTAMRLLLQSWQKAFGAGCSVNIRNVSPEELEALVGSGEYDMAFYPLRTYYYSPAGYFTQFSAAREDSLTAWTSPAFDAAVEEMRYSTAAARPQAQLEAEQLLIGADILLPVWQESTDFVCMRGISGIRMLPGRSRLYLSDAR